MIRDLWPAVAVLIVFVAFIGGVWFTARESCPPRDVEIGTALMCERSATGELICTESP